MLARKAIVVTLISLATVIWLGGCPTTSEGGRLCNQPGPVCSNLVTAGGKVLANNLGGLNPDDIQVLSDTAIEASGAAVPQLTDDQAAAVVNVMKDNGIKTVQDLQNVIIQAQADLGSVNISAEDLEVLMQLASIDWSSISI
jgi:hypothetical protein